MTAPRVSLADTLAGIDPSLTPEQAADAVLASPAVEALQAEAWQEGFNAGSRHTARARLRH